MERLMLQMSSKLLSVGLLLSVSTAERNASCAVDQDCGVTYETKQQLINWSSTHGCKPARIYEPQSAHEVARVLTCFSDKNMKIRPVGSGLSPNGLGFASNDGMDSLLSVSSIDYVKVDKSRQLVTVGAGARVISVLAELKKHGLTLQNFSSIQEQQMAGWTQVAAHGTGCTLPTVEEMIVRMQLVTPSGGIVSVSNDSNSNLFQMAKVGLGSLGVITELTLKCIPCHNLVEETFTMDSAALSIKEHYQRLSEYRHVRYMWLPYTKTVVGVVSNPSSTLLKDKQLTVEKSNSLATQPLVDLLCQINPGFSRSEGSNMSFSQLRDLLLDMAPLDTDHIKQVNRAEEAFWKLSTATRTDDSSNILGFDCGGEQWVLEMCFPIGSLTKQSGKDIAFVKKLLSIVEASEVPAPCPIEQRWTARSLAPMSPAYSTHANEVFCWVGIIMYLPPTQTQEKREEITQRFKSYATLLQPLMDEFQAKIHWAKLELPNHGNHGNHGSKSKSRDNATRDDYQQEVEVMRQRIAKQFPIGQFNALRKAVDPNSILSNDIIDTLIADRKK